MVSPPQIPRNAERAQSEGRVALVVEEEQRGQQHTHYKGRDTPKDTPARSRLDMHFRTTAERVMV
jgi:hypothetical protein